MFCAIFCLYSSPRRSNAYSRGRMRAHSRWKARGLPAIFPNRGIEPDEHSGEHSSFCSGRSERRAPTSFLKRRYSTDLHGASIHFLPPQNRERRIHRLNRSGAPHVEFTCGTFDSVELSYFASVVFLLLISHCRFRPRLPVKG